MPVVFAVVIVSESVVREDTVRGACRKQQRSVHALNPPISGVASAQGGLCVRMDRGSVHRGGWRERNSWEECQGSGERFLVNVDGAAGLTTQKETSLQPPSDLLGGANFAFICLGGAESGSTGVGGAKSACC